MIKITEHFFVTLPIIKDAFWGVMDAFTKTKNPSLLILQKDLEQFVSNLKQFNCNRQELRLRCQRHQKQLKVW